MASKEGPSTSTNVKSRFLSDYHIQELLDGGGTFGRVLKVTKKQNDQVFTMKILEETPDKNPNLEMVKACLDGLMSDIMPHKHIVTHYANFIESMSEDDLDTVDKLLNETVPVEQRRRKFFQLEPNQSSTRMLFMETEPCRFDLRHYIRQPEARQNWSLAWSLSVLRQLALGLQHMHLKGVVHRFLKPENIFMAGQEVPPEVVKISNFGVDTFHGLFYVFDLYGDAEPCLAPEQSMTKNYGPEVDLFALGVILFQLLAFPVLEPMAAEPHNDPIILATRLFRRERKLPESEHFRDSFNKQIMLGLVELDPLRRMKMERLLELLDMWFSEDVMFV